MADAIIPPPIEEKLEQQFEEKEEKGEEKGESPRSKKRKLDHEPVPEGFLISSLHISLDGIRDQSDIDKIKCKVCDAVTMDLMKCPECEGVWCTSCENMVISTTNNGEPITKCFLHRCTPMVSKVARIERSLAETGNVNCPSCNLDVKVTNLNDHYMGKCTMSQLCSCGKVYDKNYYTSHIVFCDYVTISCFLCSKSMKRGQISKHIDEDCEMGTIQCSLCHFQCRRKELKTPHVCIVSQLKAEVEIMKTELARFKENIIWQMEPYNQRLQSSKLHITYDVIPPDFQELRQKDLTLQLDYILDNSRNSTRYTPDKVNIFCARERKAILIHINRTTRCIVICQPGNQMQIEYDVSSRSLVIRDLNQDFSNIFITTRTWDQHIQGNGHPFVAPLEFITRKSIHLSVKGTLAVVRALLDSFARHLAKTLGCQAQDSSILPPPFFGNSQ